MGTVAGLTGCGIAGNMSSVSLNETLQPTSVLFVSSPPSSLAVNASATIYAATIYSSGISNGPENTLVTYSLSCGSPKACGTLSASDEVGAIVYAAPAAIPSGTTVTITATSIANPSLSRSATVTIVPPIPISVSFFGAAPALLQVNSLIVLHALIMNDVTANPQVKWTVACGGTACGAFSPTTTPSEVAATYTAPAAIPPGNTVTVTATSVTDSTKSVSAAIVITEAAPSLANGTYVFQIPGSSNSAEFITGVLVAKNGAITAGEQDAIYDDGDGPYSYFQQFSGGSYATTPTGTLEITIQLALGETETLYGTLASAQKGFVAGIDGAPGSAALDLQTGTPALAGKYAISLNAGNLYDGSPWIDGIVNVDSAGGISGKGSILDVNAEGAYYGGTETLAASSVSAPDAYGRVLFQLNPSSGSPLRVIYVAGYIVDAAHIRVTVVGNVANSDYVLGVMGGSALTQGASTGTFSAASVAGASYVFGAQGEDTRGALQLAGLLTFNAGGVVSGTLNWNDLSGRSPQSPLAFTGTYTVDPTGRVTLSNLTDGATFNYSLHLYLSGNGGGLVLASDVDDVFAGQAFLQQAGAFTAASFSGNYGLNANVYELPPDDVPQSGNVVGLVTATAGTGTDNVSGFADPNGAPADFAVSGSFAASANGIFAGTFTGFDSASPSTPNNFTLYLAAGTQGVAIETDNAQLALSQLVLVQ